MYFWKCIFLDREEEEDRKKVPFSPKIRLTVKRKYRQQNQWLPLGKKKQQAEFWGCHKKAKGIISGHKHKGSWERSALPKKKKKNSCVDCFNFQLNSGPVLSYQWDSNIINAELRVKNPPNHQVNQLNVDLNVLTIMSD